MSIKSKSKMELLQIKSDIENKFSGLHEYLNSFEDTKDTTTAVDNTANDERLKLIIEQTVKNVIKEIK